MRRLCFYKGETLLEVRSLDAQIAVTIGRHELNDICVADEACNISRFHAALFLDREGNYVLQDLGSRNGCFLNGKKRDYTLVNDEDRIEIAGYVIVLTHEADKPLEKKPRFIVVRDGAEKDLFTTNLSPSENSGDHLAKLINRPNDILMLYRLGRALLAAQDTELAAQFAVDELYHTLRPDRLFLALIEPELRLRCLAWAPDELTEFSISKTMLKLLLDEKRTVLTADASSDQRFRIHHNISKSIISLNVGSAVCIPLIWSGEVKGLLYADSAHKEAGFTSHDIAIYSSIGEDLSHYLDKLFTQRAVVEEKIRLERKLETDAPIIGVSKKLKETVEAVRRLSKTEATALITGETGTGKDLIATAIHQRSARRGKALIEINCAAIPENLLESELFGVIAQYPGMHNKEPLTGKFALAQGGTIFLNEIGELPLPLQAKLLDVIEKKRVWPLGSNAPLTIDVRIIAATNRDLLSEMKDRKFREDLYERLNMVSVQLPPLRERKDDIPLLAGYFLHLFRNRYGQKIGRLTSSSIALLLAYDWPRNVRELRNVIERAVINLNGRSTLTPDLFSTLLNKRAIPKTLMEVEKDHVIAVLEHTRGNKEKAARILGISKQTLYNKGKEYRLPEFDVS